MNRVVKGVIYVRVVIYDMSSKGDEVRNEHMLLKLLDCLEKAVILKVENTNKPHFALIKIFVKPLKMIHTSQLTKLYNEIKKRKFYSKLYNARKNELVSVKNIKPLDEAIFCYIGNKNVFWKADDM
ncbi:hypothetical protein CWI38_0438p0020 [Hamiltosporidium tvaerminnensis]|uniref:Uncharacterized protein n=1 Tax=Hamiltosporidium tvaerminnensis TaxID=1176355 RepID=A0A4Q9LZP7_9MICR|nr:hypothetical protein CWI38_0438p0020 [Hamiltosporidium tvaerminnensis]